VAGAARAAIIAVATDVDQALKRAQSTQDSRRTTTTVVPMPAPTSSAAPATVQLATAAPATIFSSAAVKPMPWWQRWMSFAVTGDRSVLVVKPPTPALTATSSAAASRTSTPLPRLLAEQQQLAATLRHRGSNSDPNPDALQTPTQPAAVAVPRPPAWAAWLPPLAYRWLGMPTLPLIRSLEIALLNAQHAELALVGMGAEAAFQTSSVDVH